jgi:hypothetical protein
VRRYCNVETRREATPTRHGGRVMQLARCFRRRSYSTSRRLAKIKLIPTNCIWSLDEYIWKTTFRTYIYTRGTWIYTFCSGTLRKNVSLVQKSRRPRKVIFCGVSPPRKWLFFKYQTSFLDNSFLHIMTRVTTITCNHPSASSYISRMLVVLTGITPPSSQFTRSNNLIVV